MVYEYANHLVARNHFVNIVHPAFSDKKSGIKKRLRSWAYYFYKVGQNTGPRDWFKLDPRVRANWVPSLDAKYIPSGDILVATAWQTAEWIVHYSNKKGVKLHLVYDYEHYKTASYEVRRRIAKALGLKIRKIATSPSVSEMLSEVGQAVERCHYVSNGIDLKNFSLKRPVEADRRLIGFPCRPEFFKGTDDAVKVFSSLHSMIIEKGYQIWSFGGPPPADLPQWINYYQRPSDRELSELYNKTAIFLVPSHYEGWGLPGAEAMACGAALVSTDNGGVRAYAEDKRTAIFCEPKNLIEMSNAICDLLDDSEFRQKIARAGCQHMKFFSWEAAVDKLESIFFQEIGT